MSVERKTARQEGFTLLEVLVSIIVLLVGVVMVAGVMLVTEQGARASEDRYLDYSELRNRMEDFKSEVSSTYPTGVSVSSAASAKTPLTKSYCTTRADVGAGGLANLVRLEMTVDQGPTAAPLQIVTYVRAVD